MTFRCLTVTNGPPTPPPQPVLPTIRLSPRSLQNRVRAPPDSSPPSLCGSCGGGLGGSDISLTPPGAQGHHSLTPTHPAKQHGTHTYDGGDPRGQLFRKQRALPVEGELWAMPQTTRPLSLQSFCSPSRECGEGL